MNVLRFLMFNRFVKLYLESDLWFLRWNKRISAAVRELWYVLSVFMPALILFMLLRAFLGDPLQPEFGWMDLITLIPFGLMMVALFNKDFFNGQSVVHRRLGYQVMDVRTGKPASKLKCMLRNITGPAWPIEAIFILVHPQRRLGDFIVGTMLAEVKPSDPEFVLEDMKTTKLDGQVILTLLVSIAIVTAFNVLFDPRM